VLVCCCAQSFEIQVVRLCAERLLGIVALICEQSESCVRFSEREGRGLCIASNFWTLEYSAGSGL
jgi:hypothetical protein